MPESALQKQKTQKPLQFPSSIQQKLSANSNGTAAEGIDIISPGAALLDTEIQVTDDDLAAKGVEKGVMTLVDSDRRETLLSVFSERLSSAEKSGGGSAANTLITAAHLGCRSFLCCRVGRDDNGRAFVEDLAQAGVATNANAPAADDPTGQCLVMITPDAERSMCTYLGASAGLSDAELDLDALGKARLLYLEGYQVSAEAGLAASLAALKHARNAGKLCTLSLSDPAMATFFNEPMRRFLDEGLDIVFCNRDEALAIAKTESLDEAVEFLLKHTAVAVITLGSEGAMVASADGRMHAKVQAVKAVDTNGAGDTFAGAFLAAMLAGKNLSSALTLANRAAAAVVSQFKPRLAKSTLQSLEGAESLA